MPKYWAGQKCSEAASDRQIHDTNNSYAGSAYDRRVEKGETFPPGENNHHHQEK